MDQGAAGFRALTWSPGNPDFPTLPTPGADTVGKITEFGSLADLPIPFEHINVIIENGVGRAEFAGWYLDTIWRTPDPVDFGNITAPKRRTITLHNTNRTSVQLTAIDTAAIVGLSVVSPGLPETIDAFSSLEVVVEMATAGDASFNTPVDFTVGGLVIPITMIGRRVIIFDTMPQKIVLEQVSFLTDLMLSDDGTEQVMATRHAPRSNVKMNIRHTNDVERTRLTNLILGAAFLPQGIQLWWQSRELTSAALSTDSVLQISTADMEIENEGDLSVVLPDASNFEVEVLSFDTSSITLTQDVGQALPMGTSVMPIKYGVMRESVGVAAFAVNAADMGPSFDLLDYANIGAVDPAYFTTHPVDGLPIPLTELFFEGASLRGSLDSNQTRLDSKTGQISQDRSEPIGRPGHPMIVYCDSQADQHAWRKFIHFLRGSWGKFYVATGQRDLPLSTDFTLGGNTFQIPSMGVTNLLNNVAPRRDVRITIADVDYHRRITNITNDGTDETVTISSIIPGSGSVPAADVFVSWLALSRLVGDVATFTHHRRSTSELRFNVRGVIDGV